MASEAGILLLLLVPMGSDRIETQLRGISRSGLYCAVDPVRKGSDYVVNSSKSSSVRPGSFGIEQAAGVCLETGGYEVALQTGLFVHKETDLSIDDLVPIRLTRTYRQN